MSVSKKIEMLTPWSAFAELFDQQGAAQMLATRLKNDLPQGHVLEHCDVRAVARRSDKDYVLFEIIGAESRLAVVHMTWRKESDPHWPSTRVFRNWREFADKAMIPDHREFTAGSE